MQKLDKFNYKANVILNGLEKYMSFHINNKLKYMSFHINNKLTFIDCFQFLSSTLDDLVKILGKDNFKCLD